MGAIEIRQSASPVANNLTRRANHLHMFNIARILGPRRETGRGLFASGIGRISLGRSPFGSQTTKTN
jgi:hypothetical protein